MTAPHAGHAHAVRVLTWNLYHGRSRPPAGRDLLPDFAAALASWSWDVALLQEVPPWWLRPLGEACGASGARVLTSRNLGLRVRRAAAERWPDRVASSGGSANAILVRGRRIVEHRSARLCWLPERRWAHGARLEGDAGWFVNLHATLSHEPQRTARDLHRSVAHARDWAGEARLVLGGDLNLRRFPAEAGLQPVAGHWVDHLAVAGWTATGPGRTLDRGTLSDHAPLAVELA